MYKERRLIKTTKFKKLSLVVSNFSKVTKQEIMQLDHNQSVS